MTVKVHFFLSVSSLADRSCLPLLVYIDSVRERDAAPLALRGGRYKYNRDVRLPPAPCSLRVAARRRQRGLEAAESDSTVPCGAK